MRNKHISIAILLVLFLAMTVPVIASGLYGYLRDQNWYSRRFTTDPYGVGMYEFGINANGRNIEAVGGADFSDIYGAFDMTGLTGGTYTVSSWAVWWRPALAFNVNVPASGNVTNVDLRLKSTMWGYAAFWEDAGYYEHGQTFKASGPISMIYLRCPGDANYTLTMHEGGPGGSQVGISRSFGKGDTRIAYNYGDMPTVAGQMYYLRVRTDSPTYGGVISQMDPRPDYSDPMPDGCLYLGNGGTPTAYPDRDLGVCIMSDDDGLITNLNNLGSGSNFYSVSSVGQSFVARGVGLIRASIHSPTADFVGVFKVRAGGPTGAQVGTTKRAKVGQWATPECVALWAPGECPLTPGQTYYLEVTRDGGGPFTAYASGNVFNYGHAYINGGAQTAFDLTGCFMEEESTGSATRSAVAFTTYPSVSEANRGSASLTVTWNTNVASDSLVEFAEEHGPYTSSVHDPLQALNHSVTLNGLKPNTQYHFRVTSARAGYNSAVTRDLVICTKPVAGTNLLVNPGFEEGTGASPRWPIPGWTNYGSVDVKASDGTWFWGIPSHTGTWLVEGAVNGGNSDGGIYQRVSATSGRRYSFSAFVTTWMRENSTWKYDVWNDRNRLEYMRLGTDPYGGTNPSSSSIIWTPRMYSHLRYSNLAVTATAASSNITVFVSMKGTGGEWHLYGVDECALTELQSCYAPSILTHPSDQTKYEGESASFAVSAAGTEPLSYQWRHDGSNISGANSPTYTISSVSSSDAGSYDCVVTNGCGSATSNAATLTVLGPFTIADAKVQADNNAVTLTAKTVVATFSDGFYIEEDDQSTGIRVIEVGHGQAVGNKVTVTGVLKTAYNGERYVDATTITAAGSGSVAPVMLTNREVGGADWNYMPGNGAGQKGVKDAAGLNNIGMLVSTAGRVTYVASSYYFVDDGSSLNDGSGYLGVRVLAEGTILPVRDQMVVVTGACSCFKSGTDLQRLIRATSVTAY